MNKLISFTVFHVTLLWEALWCRLLPRRKWWNEIDDGVFLGAVPSRRELERLRSLGIRAVVNMCDEYELPCAVYSQLGMQPLRLPTIDRRSPSFESVCRAIAFISRHRKNGDSVYIHCRAGRGRGTTIALCWLIKAYTLTPEEAYARLLKRRMQIDQGLDRQEVIRRFWMDNSKS